jgi:hypothetical protein
MADININIPPSPPFGAFQPRSWQSHRRGVQLHTFMLPPPACAADGCQHHTAISHLCLHRLHGVSVLAMAGEVNTHASAYYCADDNATRR